MLWHGGVFSGPGVFLLGVSVTASLTVGGIWAQASSFTMTRIAHILVIACYLPLLPIVVELLPKALAPTRITALLTLILTVALLGSIHIATTRSLRSPSTVIPPPTSIALSETASAYVLAHSSASNYHKSVIELEQKCSDFRYVQYRVAPYFLPAKAVEHVADLRFGTGDAQRERYIKSQEDRRAAFFRLIGRGASVREIYPRGRLLSYVESGTHFADLWPLTPELMQQLLVQWRDAIVHFGNYNVAIADESVPMKYHVLDSEAIIFHEPIGRGDSHRINSLFILDPALGATFAQDFDLIWSLIPPKWRDPSGLAQWIDTELIPLALKRSIPPQSQRRTKARNL